METQSVTTSAGISEHYCLKWSNFSHHVVEILSELIKTQSMVDITLCAGGEKILAHRTVLCAYSTYFKDILSQVNDPHPVVILAEMSAQDVRGILEFLYCGALNVEAKRISAVLEVAESLQISTLIEVINHLRNFSLSSEQPSAEVKDSSEASSLQLATTDIVLAPMEMEVALAVEVSNSLQNAPDQEATEDNKSTIEKQKLLEVHSPEREFDPIIYCPNGTSENEEINEQGENIDGRNCKQITESEPDEEKETYCDERKRRRRRQHCRKDYSEEQLNCALSDLRAGRFLGETAASHKIPRSTLYVRAKAAGVAIAITRQEHTAEQVQAAVNAVVGGASLQQASTLYQIPKTVLWRRVQSAGGRHIVQQKQTQSLARRQAAVEALQNGQNLSKVSYQFQIPKTTLFREKTRLVQTGKLPWKRRKNSGVSLLKQTRLSEAVTACQEGKMSQAIASATFQVPKTTIWRRLKEKEQAISCATDEPASTVERIREQPFTFSEGSNQIPIAYIVDTTEFPGTPIII